MIDPLWTAKAAAYHATHPEVYEALVTYTRQAKDAGHEKIGIDLVFGRLRWDHLTQISPDTQEPYKLSNGYRAWYARKIMETEDDLAGIFNTRETAHDPTYHERQAALPLLAEAL